MAEAVSTAELPVPARPASRARAEPSAPLRAEALASDLDPALVQLLSGAAAGAGLFAAGLGVLALLGWGLGLPALAAFNAAWITMKVNTAAALVLTGVSLFLAFNAWRWASYRWATRVFAALVAVVSYASLLEYATHRDFWIDRLLFAEPIGGMATVYPGRMSELTAVCLALCSLALLLLSVNKDRLARLASMVAVPAALISLIALFGYLFGGRELQLWRGQVTPMAFPTAAAIFALSTGLMLVRPDVGVLRPLASRHLGGVMLRVALPWAICLPALIVWLRMLAEALGVVEQAEAGWVMVAAAMTVVGSALLFGTAGMLNRVDATRLKIDAQLQQLNSELDRKLIELETANHELEAFSYSTSHVMSAPLRAIDGFVEILLSEHAGQLDDEGKRMLGLVRGGAKDMAVLIDGILEFLRIGQQPMDLRPVDMERLARGAFAALKPKLDGRRVAFRIGPLPAVQGDAETLGRVWANLLDNAVKFTQPVKAAVIEVGATRKAAETVYWVKDNGVGFDMQYIGKLFGVFQRLHGVEEFAGAGMGLAMVKRIVTRHGGRVWAEGAPGKGATFYFALPARPVPEPELP